MGAINWPIAIKYVQNHNRLCMHALSLNGLEARRGKREEGRGKRKAGRSEYQHNIIAS